MLSIILLMRQDLATQGQQGFTLEEQEALETTDWNELVRKSHMKINI